MARRDVALAQDLVTRTDRDVGTVSKQVGQFASGEVDVSAEAAENTSVHWSERLGSLKQAITAATVTVTIVSGLFGPPFDTSSASAETPRVVYVMPDVTAARRPDAPPEIQNAMRDWARLRESGRITEEQFRILMDQYSPRE